MPHVSDLFGATFIDDEARFAKPIDANGVSESGFRARDLTTDPVGSVAGAIEFPRDMILDEKTIREMVEEQDRKESSLYHVLKRGPKVYRNQSPSSYCWTFGSLHAYQAWRVFTNQKPVLLSPFSLGCPIDNYANRGGWGIDSLKRLVSHGVAEERFWPSAPIDGSSPNKANNNAIYNGRQYDTPEMRANALLYRVQEWWDLPTRNFLAKCSAVLRHRAVSSGYNALGHQMCTVRIVILKNGDLGAIDADSYGSGGMFNEYAMGRRLAAAEDMCTPRA